MYIYIYYMYIYIYIYIYYICTLVSLNVEIYKNVSTFFKT